MTTPGIIAWIVVAILILLVVGTVAVAGYYAFVTRKIARQVREVIPPPGRFVTVDGDRIHCVEEGEGRPLLFVHGLGGTVFNFTYPLFADLRDEFRLVAFDRPGSGYSTRSGDRPATPREQADFVAAFIDETGLEKPLVVGHSLGGAIALALALHHPEKIAGLALLSPLTHQEREVSPAFEALKVRSPLFRRVLAHTVAVPAAVKYRDATLAYVFGPNEPPEDYAVAGGAMLSLLPSHFYATSTDFVAIGNAMQDQETRYGAIDMPVGILFGTDDRLLDPERHGRGMADKIEDLDLELLEDTGHMPQYSEPERVAAFIRRMAGKAFGQAISTER